MKTRESGMPDEAMWAGFFEAAAVPSALHLRENCRAWAEAAGFELLPPGQIDLPPYHYGMAFRVAAAVE